MLGPCCWVGFTLLAVSGGCSLVWCVATSFVVEHRPGVCGLQQLWFRGSLLCGEICVDLQFDPCQDQTRVSCISKWILYHWATRDAPLPPIDSYRLSHSSLIFFSAIWRSCLILIVVQIRIQIIWITHFYLWILLNFVEYLLYRTQLPTVICCIFLWLFLKYQVKTRYSWTLCWILSGFGAHLVPL